MPAEYFIANSNEVTNLKNFEDLFALMQRYENFGGISDFQAVYSLSRLFFQDEKHIPKDIHKHLADSSKIYLFGEDFVTKIASFDREEMNSLASMWREDEYWKAKNYFGMGIWSDLYELYDLCKIALRENKNLNLVDESNG
ncbi:MAG: hypothetical protein ABJA66_00285 [Actinomycetota bacterium]